MFASMFGSLAFGFVHHYVVQSPDRVSHVAADGWGMLFKVTAVLLAASEVFGCWVGALGWMRGRASKHARAAEG